MANLSVYENKLWYKLISLGDSILFSSSSNPTSVCTYNTGKGILLTTGDISATYTTTYINGANTKITYKNMAAIFCSNSVRYVYESSSEQPCENITDNDWKTLINHRYYNNSSLFRNVTLGIDPPIFIGGFEGEYMNLAFPIAKAYSNKLYYQAEYNVSANRWLMNLNAYGHFPLILRSDYDFMYENGYFVYSKTLFYCCICKLTIHFTNPSGIYGHNFSTTLATPTTNMYRYEYKILYGGFIFNESYGSGSTYTSNLYVIQINVSDLYNINTAGYVLNYNVPNRTDQSSPYNKYITRIGGSLRVLFTYYMNDWNTSSKIQTDDMTIQHALINDSSIQKSTIFGTISTTTIGAKAINNIPHWQEANDYKLGSPISLGTKTIPNTSCTYTLKIQPAWMIHTGGSTLNYAYW